MRSTILAGVTLSAGLAMSAAASNIDVTVENMLSSGGFSFTPVWMALHDGSFNTFDNGTMASGWDGLTEIAEGGDTGPLSDRFSTSQPAGMQTTLVQGDGAPVFSPGEMQSTNIAAGDATVNRYFSFASMVVPSNDLFFGNDNGMAYEVFDAAGNFNGPIVIEIYGSSVYDAGTEVNDAFGGAAFSANGGNSVDEAVVIRSLFTDGGDAGYLASFVGTGTADGGSIAADFGAADLIARITIVPAPGTLMMGMVGLGGLARRRR